jgi:hypothetical protein
MAKRRIKKQDHERLDDATLERVSSLLAGTPPITKKKACELLNISYNTARLNRILEEYDSDKAYRQKRYNENKRKPIQEYEVREIVLNYLKGESMASIAKGLYRTINMVKNVLDEYGVPRHQTGDDYYQKPELIPDAAVAEKFNEGELVWSARYNCVAEVKYLQITDWEHGPVYSLWVFGKYNERAYQPWYELGKLPILNKLNISTEEISR